MNNFSDASKAIRRLASPEKALILQRFFKTGKGEYGEGDRFLGVMVPQIRALVKNYRDLELIDIEKLLGSPFNEERLLALLILNEKYSKTDGAGRGIIFKMYLKNLDRVNNWNLVDSSAPNIVGQHLLNRSRKLLYELVSSEDLWRRRVSVVSTYHFIKNGDLNETLKISELLLEDEHDLMHKACGWMLREAGKREPSVLKKFLGKHHRDMPRTMLRYAIEKFPERERQAYLKK